MVAPEHPCNYLPGRVAQSRALATSRMPPQLYQRFMDANFRRSGNVIYQPICRGCRGCMQIRIPVEQFTLSRSQRRCRRRNADLEVTVGEPTTTEEKYQLYLRYLAGRYDRHEGDSREEFDSFLCATPVDSIELVFRDASKRLLAVSICDVCDSSLSSVYCYYEPSIMRRSLGTFSALREIELARQMRIPWYYLGYWVAGARTMEYKASFRPHQLLYPDGQWREQHPPA
jgi:arginine-tRNA-protein transferase